MRTVPVYKFAELSQEAQNKVLTRLYDINVDHDWWDSVYDNAATIGIKINSFNIGNGNDEIDIRPDYAWSEIATCVLNTHGETCATYVAAVVYKMTGDEKRFEAELTREYLRMLTAEYEFLTSESAIIETIESNDYEFFSDGRLYRE